jgi:hypothetical protein
VSWPLEGAEVGKAAAVAKPSTGKHAATKTNTKTSSNKRKAPVTIQDDDFSDEGDEDREDSDSESDVPLASKKRAAAVGGYTGAKQSTATGRAASVKSTAPAAQQDAAPGLEPRNTARNNALAKFLEAMQMAELEAAEDAGAGTLNPKP